METLLICPATRSEIVIGKFGTVMLFSVSTAVLNLISSNHRKTILQQVIKEQVKFDPRRRQDVDMIFIAANSVLATIVAERGILQSTPISPNIPFLPIVAIVIRSPLARLMTTSASPSMMM